MKGLGRVIAWKLLEFTLGGVIAYIAWDPVVEPAPSLLIGLMPVVILELIQVNWFFHKMEHLPERLTSMSETMSRASGAQELLLKAVELSGKPELSHKEVWTALTKLLRDRYVATNYIKKIYDGPDGERIVTLQVAKHEAREVSFEKIFVVDDEAELKTPEFTKWIALHRSKGAGGITLAWVARAALGGADLKKEVDRVGGIDSSDFAVFDDAVVLVWELNAAREAVGWDLVIGAERARPFVALFKSMKLCSTAI